MSYILALYFLKVIEVSGKLYLCNGYKHVFGKISRTYLQGLHKCNLTETQVFSGNLETTVKIPVLHNHRLLDH